MNKPKLTLVIQPEAEADLIEIGDYIARDNRVAAQQLIERIQQKSALITHYPELGQERGDISDGLLHFPVGQYLILYRARATTLEIVRVIHTARRA